MGRHELTFAAGVLGRGFRDNPITVAVVGGDPLRRMRGAERVLGSYVRLMDHPPLAARRGDWIVGVCGMAPPGTCHPPLLQQLRMVTAMLRSGPVVMSRYLRVSSAWEKQDPADRHWHLGPVAVEPGLQGMSIGSQMLERFCTGMDSEGEVAYLETDKPENVRFYEKFGFETVGETLVLGASNWFMRREPARR
ncbi:MAG: family N-acetyltransferase, partial [Dehalococcoidia bacterium]|nr:family N-acetyltransferase [Dehalococcoidia bacterium]